MQNWESVGTGKKEWLGGNDPTGLSPIIHNGCGGEVRFSVPNCEDGSPMVARCNDCSSIWRGVTGWKNEADRIALCGS
jgi:hypothetical protein